MEPHRKEPQKAPDPSTEQKPRRFRIVKLEERIAPTKGGKVSQGHATRCGCTECCYATIW
jgi:hypothetical protein